MTVDCDSPQPYEGCRSPREIYYISGRLPLTRKSTIGKYLHYLHEFGDYFPGPDDGIELDGSFRLMVPNPLAGQFLRLVKIHGGTVKSVDMDEEGFKSYEVPQKIWKRICSVDSDAEAGWILCSMLTRSGA